jgi:hypothetical protein
MRNRFCVLLSAQHGIDKDWVGTWTVERPPHLQALKRSGVFAPMGGTTVRQALNDLLGPGSWREPRTWGLPLVSFPVLGARSSVPSAGWHVDSYGPDHDLPGVSVSRS